MPKLDDQISTLQEKLTQLKLRQQRLDARKRAIEALRERKAMTRRKILVGGIVLAKVEQGEIDGGQFRGWLDQALSRTDDRALFGLPLRNPPPLTANHVSQVTNLLPNPASTSIAAWGPSARPSASGSHRRSRFSPSAAPDRASSLPQLNTLPPGIAAVSFCRACTTPRKMFLPALLLPSRCARSLHPRPAAAK